MRKVVIHPFLFALIPVISLWVINADYITPIMVYRSLILAVVAAIVLFLLAYLFVRDWQQAGVATSIVLMVVFTYGHFYTGLKEMGFPATLVRHRYLVPIAVMLMVFVEFLVLRYKKVVPSVSLFFTVVGITLAVMPTTRLLVHLANTESTSGALPQFANEASSAVNERTPDIYYIILDAYGRQDVLSELYHYDNSEFLQALEQRGFYVASASASNYMQTLKSLSSSLNMDYLDDFLQENNGRLSVKDATGLIVNSRLRRFLSDRGYKTVAFGTSFEDFSKVDIFLKPPEKKDILAQSTKYLNEFEGMLVNTTIGKAWLDSYIKSHGEEIGALKLPYLLHKSRVLFALTEIGDVAKQPGKKLVIAHAVSPHPPFIFNKDGGDVPQKTLYGLNDGSDFEGSPEEYIAGYVEQIQYINKLTLMAVDEIIKNSQEPPIIIIQGDHGPGAYLDFSSVDNSNIPERMSILNAYYFPDGNYGNLYSSISPVNSFRVVLDQFFGMKMDLLQDNHYFSTGSNNYPQFINVNDRLKKP
jgi:hypothetical protein